MGPFSELVLFSLQSKVIKGDHDFKILFLEFSF